MKKFSVLLIFIMLLNLFTTPVSADTLTNLFSSSTLVWGNWSTLGANLVDGDLTTYSTLGTHTAGSKGVYNFKVSNDGSVRYNKLVVDVKRFNSDPIYLKSSNTLSGTEPTQSGKSTITLANAKELYDYTHPEPVSTTGKKLVFSFDSTTDKYIQLMSVVADSTADGFAVNEVYLYYATPASVKINTTYSDIKYGTGGSVNSSANIMDSAGNTIKDSEFSGITWSLNSSADGVTIDAKTGKITVSEDAPVQTVTVTATSTYKSSLYATKTFKITAPELTNLLTSASKVWSPWSGNLCANLLDGDDTTFYNAGEHTAGSPGRIIFKVSSDNSIKYNKVAIDVTRFNSTAYALSSSDTLNGEEPATNTTSTVNLSSAKSLTNKTLDTARTDVSSETLRFTFDTTDDKYLRFENTVAESSPTYGIRIPEFKLYYATPAKIDMSISKSRVLVGQPYTITSEATVRDAQGDVLNDSTLNGVVWSVNADASGVTIDSATGKITVSDKAPIQDVTVTAKSKASGFSKVSATKPLKISSTAEPTFSERVKDGSITDLTFEVAQDNNKVGALLSFTSNAKLDAPYIVVLALYDSNDKLCALEVKNIESVNKGVTNTTVSKAMNSTYKKAKIYALDGEFAPLSKVKEKTMKTIDSLKIFSIGNSAGEDATRYVWSVANSMGIENVVVGHMLIGGCTLKKHWENIESNSAIYNYLKSTSATVVSTKNATMLDCLKDEDWDIIVIQQNGSIGGDLTLYEPYLTNIINFVKKNATNKNIKFAWHMTIPYQGDYTASGFANYNYDQMTMYNALVNAVKKVIIPNGNFDIIIPNGTVAQNVRSSFIGDTITRDGGHMSYNVGRLMAAMGWVRALSGMSTDFVTFTPSTSITEAEIDVIKRSVNAAQKSPYSITQMTSVNNGVTNN